MAARAVRFVYQLKSDEASPAMCQISSISAARCLSDDCRLCGCSCTRAEGRNNVRAAGDGVAISRRRNVCRQQLAQRSCVMAREASTCRLRARAKPLRSGAMGSRRERTRSSKRSFGLRPATGRCRNCSAETRGSEAFVQQIRGRNETGLVRMFQQAERRHGCRDSRSHGAVREQVAPTAGGGTFELSAAGLETLCELPVALRVEVLYEFYRSAARETWRRERRMSKRPGGTARPVGNETLRGCSGRP